MTTKRTAKDLKLRKRMDAAVRRADASIGLARTYILDGGLFEGARHLREAADAYEAAGRIRNEALGVPA